VRSTLSKTILILRQVASRWSDPHKRQEWEYEAKRVYPEMVRGDCKKEGNECGCLSHANPKKETLSIGRYQRRFTRPIEGRIDNSDRHLTDYAKCDGHDRQEGGIQVKNCLVALAVEEVVPN
jgi:hypothetical protein